tara:strand:- start:1788 stop:2465 length:678 start_codon:yes stop_codon:yes gene_type:complete
MKDIREMNQSEKKDLMNQIFDSGHFDQEIFELLLKCPLKTTAELNIELSTNPRYYPKYLSNKNLTQLDIYYNIITDLDEIGIEGWDLGPTQRQIYKHLNILIYNEEILRKAGIISQILDGICPHNDMKPIIDPTIEQYKIKWEEYPEPYKYDDDHWTKEICTIVEHSIPLHNGQQIYLHVCRDNMEIEFLTDSYFETNNIPKLSNGIYEGAEEHYQDDNLLIYWD